jgi:hypothetical protein
MHDSCITVGIDLVYLYSIIVNFLSYLRKSFILIKCNSAYFLLWNDCYTTGLIDI